MRRLILVAAMVLMAAPAYAQLTLGQPAVAAWNGAANEADAGVDAYQVRLDADTAWVAAGGSVPRAEYQYQIPQARLTVGSHTVAVRACAGAVCGPELSAAFTVGRPLPGVPTGLTVRPVPSVAILTTPEAAARANAYALLTIDRYLTASELGWLAARHPPEPPTRDTVLRLMDAAYAELVTPH